MAKANSHLFSRMEGSVAGLTYSRSGKSYISLRARNSPDHVKTPMMFRSVQLTKDAALIWRQFSDNQRALVRQWYSIEGPLGTGMPDRGADTPRLAWTKLIKLAWITGIVNWSNPIAQFLPAIERGTTYVIGYQFSSPGAGQLRLTLGAPAVFTGRYYSRILGPYQTTVMRRPTGWKSLNALTLTVASAASFSINRTALISTRRYFSLIEGVALNASGLVYLGSWEGRQIIA